MPSRGTSGKRPRPSSTANAALFAALGDETRLKLVTQLGGGESLSIAALANDSKLSRQAITKHLLVLERAGLAVSRRDGRECRWRLNADQLKQAQRCLDVIALQWEGALGRLKSTLEK